MSRHVVCSALGVATLTLAVCSSACVQTQDEHRPAAQALADLRVSAEAGDAEAQFILGGMYVTGRGGPQDDAEAVAWYRRAAEQGHARAQYTTSGQCTTRAEACRRMTPKPSRGTAAPLSRATPARSTTSGACVQPRGHVPRGPRRAAG